jgi:hypothetical protein
LWTDDKGKAIGAEIAVQELAKLGINHQTKDGIKGSIIVRSPESLVFGFRAVELVRVENPPGLRVRLDYTYIDVLGTTADDRDYVLLPDAWSGNVFLDLQTFRS